MLKKYRIIKRKCLDGEISYKAQVKVLFLFWASVPVTFFGKKDIHQSPVYPDWVNSETKAKKLISDYKNKRLEYTFSVVKEY